MHYGAVTNADLILDIQRPSVRRVNNRPVLDIDASSDRNRRHVTANGDVVHDRALVADRDLTANICCGGDVDVLADGGADDIRFFAHAGNCSVRVPRVPYKSGQGLDGMLAMTHPPVI